MIGLFANGTTIWAAAGVALAGVVAYQLGDPPPGVSDDVAAPVETADGDAAMAVAQLPSDDLVDAIAARPLFSQSRRPAEPAPSADMPAEVPAEDKPVLELIGTLRVGDAPVALLQHPTDGVLRLRPGESVGGWTIVAVEDRLVRLEDEDGPDELTLREDRSPPPTRERRRQERNPQERDRQEPEVDERAFDPEAAERAPRQPF